MTTDTHSYTLIKMTIFVIKVTVRDMYPGLTTEVALIGILTEILGEASVSYRVS